jgi:hypothetical protein
MARLPTPGGDDGNWGQILNDYLAVEHDDSGSLKDVARPADVAAKYTKPAGGIPGSDIASGAITNTQLDAATQAAVTRANSSLQAANNFSDLAAPVTARGNLLVYKPDGLRRARAAFAGGRTAPFRVLYGPGDSTTFGIGSDGTQSTTDTSGAGFNAPDQLRSLLSVSLGGGEGQMVLPSDNRVSKTNASASPTTGVFSTTSYSMSGGAAQMTFPALRCTSIEVICLWNRTGSGAFNYQIDAGSVTASAAPAVTTYNNYYITTISGLSDGTHSIKITPPDSTLKVYIVGIVYRTETGPVVMRLGKAGSTSSDVVNGNGGITAGLSTRQYHLSMTNVWQPHLVVLPIGINDQGGYPGNSITPAIYATNLQKIIDYAVTPAAAANVDYGSGTGVNTPPPLITSTGASVLLLVGPNAATVGSLGQQAYWDAAKALCDSNDHVSFLNLADHYGTQAAASASDIGLQLTSSVHSTTRGYGLNALLVKEAITGSL